MNKHPKIVQADKRGQIVIPQSVRNSLNIKEGAAFWVYEPEDGIFLKKVVTPSKNEIKKSIRKLKNE